MPSLFDLSGRVAVIVGGTSGIGRSIAEGLSNHGAVTIAAGRSSASYPVNVRERTSIDVLRDQVLAEHGHVDILVNAAGVTLKKPSLQMHEPEWQDLFDTNVTGALRACQSFHEPLKLSRRGRVINIASLGSFLAFHQVAAYCASKAAILSLTRSLGCEWAADCIRVNAIVPGVFPTELNRALIEGTERGREILLRTPMARFGKAEELVGAAVLLASDGASFITGQFIAVDGGYLASGVNQ